MVASSGYTGLRKKTPSVLVKRWPLLRRLAGTPAPPPPTVFWQRNPGRVLGYQSFLAALPCSRDTSDRQPLPHLALTWVSYLFPSQMWAFVRGCSRTPPSPPLCQHTQISSQGERGLSPRRWGASGPPTSVASLFQWPSVLSFG